MNAITEKKARLLDLTTSVLELTRDGKRDIEGILRVFQIIKNDPHFAKKFNLLWKTLTIGGKSPKELLAELEKGGFSVSNWAKNMMNNPAFTTANNPLEISLVRIKVRDLGFTEFPTTDELFARAKEQGLDFCPAEVGPHLRLAFNDQLLADYCRIAMEPIIYSIGYPGVFSVLRSRDGERWWLDAQYASPEYRWGLGNSIAFCFCK